MHTYCFPGPVGLSAVLLKKCSKSLSFPLDLLMQRFSATGVLLKIWKIPTVIPIFKKGGKYSASNYRPISFIVDKTMAFDRVPHHRFLHKLEHLGVRGPLLDWLSSYLRGRIFRVRVSSHLSDEAELYSGVTQGSVIGPLLFLLDVFDLFLCIKSRIFFSQMI